MKGVSLMNNKLAKKGAIFLILTTIIYFIIEFIVANAWNNPTYNYLFNWVSDLGVPVNTTFQGHHINSPLYTLMNFEFTILGLSYIIGFNMIRSLYLSKRKSTLLSIIAGLGVIIVASFPGYEYNLSFMHQVGAMLIVFGAYSLMYLSGKEFNIKWYKITCNILIVIGIVGFILTFVFSNSDYAGLVERILLYPYALFPIITGIAILSQSQKQED